MDKTQQKLVKAAFKMKSKMAKDAALNQLGETCACCARKPRRDKGNRRGQNSRSQRRSRRIAGNTADEEGETRVEYISQAHSSTKRQDLLKRNKGKKKKRRQSRGMKTFGFARDAQEQNGEPAIEARLKAMESLVRAMTMSTIEPKATANQGELETDQRKDSI
jgi:hypothetical protein